VFEWDENKNNSNLFHHKLSFEDAHFVFEGETITFEDQRKDYETEKRYITLGLLENRLVVIVHTPRGDNQRIISMRKGNSREKRLFEERSSKN